MNKGPERWLRAFVFGGARMVVEFEEAVRLVLEQASAAVELKRGSIERARLMDALGRVLAEEMRADRDQPGFDRSTRDGFALRAEDWVPGAQLKVVGQIRAGSIWEGDAVHRGEALEIMTGAPMPRGADTVVMVEHVSRRGDSIGPLNERSLAVGENVVKRGSEARVGAEVVPPGTRIGAAEIALAAACGCAELPVFRRRTVAIVATGDELVELGQEPEPQQIRNSNSYALAAMVTLAGGLAQRLGIARDVRKDVRAKIVKGRASDLLILSGGVSMGEYDLVEEALMEFGAEFFFTGVRMQPGKPVVFGRLPERPGATECYFFGLPGNPISTQVTFHCFAGLFLRVLEGECEVNPLWAQATLAEKVDAKPGVTRLLPARMHGGVEVRLVGWQGSGDLPANARANCYAELLPDRAYNVGEVIRVLLR